MSAGIPYAGLDACIGICGGAMPRRQDNYRVNGRWWALWVFDSLGRIAAHRPTRQGDGDAPEEILGDRGGIITCDGAKVFGRCERKRRCRARMLGEPRCLGRLRHGNRGAAHRHEARQDTSRRHAVQGSALRRRMKRCEFAGRVGARAGEFGGDKALREFAVTLDDAAFVLFPFVEYPEVAPTNNPAGRPAAP